MLNENIPTDPMMRLSLTLILSILLAVLAGCERDSATEEPAAGPALAEPASPAALQEGAFETVVEDLIEKMLALSPEWAIRQGRYEFADQVSIPDDQRRQRERAFAEAGLERLGAFDPESLPPSQRAEHAMLVNLFNSRIWYQEQFRAFEWMPSLYNVAGPINVLLITDYAPLPERLTAIAARLEQVPAYYQAARDNITTPTHEHTELAIGQNRGALRTLRAQIVEAAVEAELEAELEERLESGLDKAEEAIEEWIEWLETLKAGLVESGQARPFRIGETLYEQKFAFDIQADFSAAELYQRALAEKRRLHQQMDEVAVELWPRYFPDAELPEAPLERIGRLIDHLSDQHVALEDFVEEIRRQIPKLEAFVRDNDLLDQDPDKPLVVRETPEYMRGTGAIASISAPGPFNPGAETFYNVTPLDTFGEELAASYLREYNHWILQILNIHEAIPGHYTQLLHANRSPSLVKSLFGNGAMIEGWAVYAERMMLEQGWGDHEPELWLIYGKWALRVVFNAILDYAVHVLGMSEQEAVELMRYEAFQEKSEATQKWRRLTLSQVQLTSYFSGFAEIYDFREQLKSEMGEAFDLKTFHNDFLSHGSAPVRIIIELMRADGWGKSHDHDRAVSVSDDLVADAAQ